jgi:hypothetical protein
VLSDSDRRLVSDADCKTTPPAIEVGDAICCIFGGSLVLACYILLTLAVARGWGQVAMFHIQLYEMGLEQR